jgi:cytochrome c-type biogenesis protein CcmH/NrfF
VTLAAGPSTVIAHAGHWLLDILYVIPVVVVAVAVIVSWARTRREDARSEKD